MVHSMVRRVVTTLAFVASTILAVAVSGGCEALVPDTVPAFGCTGTNANVCPASQVCAPTLGRCVERSGACTIVASMCAPGTHCDSGTQMCVVDGLDGSVPDQGTGDGGPPGMDGPPPPSDGNQPDTNPPTDSGRCTGVGCPCTTNGACDGDICADMGILTGSVTMGQMCTQTCCASSECPDGSVCFATGTGGNYCVPSSALGRTVGTVAGGGSCATDATCRSGKCGQGGKCADACCSDSNCTNGAQCALDTTTSETNGHQVLQCTGNSGSHLTGTTCTTNGYCHGGACEPDPTSSFNSECMQPCCSTANAGTPGAMGCGTGFACYALNVNPPADWIPVCSQPSGNDTDGQPLTIGTGGMGASCTLNRDCRSTHCFGGRCTDVCCSDADCTVVAGWVCRPRPGAGTNGVFLRCGTPL
jgi:hypothetical protein